MFSLKSLSVCGLIVYQSESDERKERERMKGRERVKVGGGDAHQEDHGISHDWKPPFPISSSALQGRGESDECSLSNPPSSSNGLCSHPEDVAAVSKALGQPLNQLDNPIALAFSMQALKKQLNCDSESCVYEHPRVQSALGKDRVNEILETKFRVAGPNKSRRILYDDHIDGVLRQLKRMHSDFYCLPYQTIDFVDKNQELALFDWQTHLARHPKRTKVGVVINTDVEEGEGKHWFALYMDFSQFQLEEGICTVEFFNSSGNKPVPQMQAWIDRFVSRCEKSLFIRAKVCPVVVAQFRHQMGNTECGVYSLFYIWQRLEGRSYKDFQKYRVADDQVAQVRQRFFRDDKLDK